jgi:hypothetical protein
MAEALGALPIPKLIIDLVAGPWCARIPLWANPVLLGPGDKGLEKRSNLQISELTSEHLIDLGELLRSRTEIEDLTTHQIRWMGGLWLSYGRSGCPLKAIPCQLLEQYRFTENLQAKLKDILVRSVATIAEKLPAAWIEAGQGNDNSTIQEVEEKLLSALGWELRNTKYSLAKVTVKAATLLQLNAIAPPQQALLQQYASLINEDCTARHVTKMLSRLWSRPCEGRALEPFWLLALNGVATAARMDKLLGQPCGCNERIEPDLKHLFFECRILKRLLDSVNAQFQGSWSIPQQVQHHHIWLATRPHSQLHQGIWDLVVIFLIRAFDNARANWVDRVKKHQNNAPVPTRSSRTAGSAHRPAMAPGVEMIESVGSVCLTEFWSYLSEFISLNTLPTSWLDAVPSDHPFIQPDLETRIWRISRLE